MSKIYQLDKHLLMEADYQNLKLHKHLASHIIISLGSNMEWQVGEEHICCRGICIGPDVLHTGTIPKEGVLVFLFTPISNYAFSLKQRYLERKPYERLEDSLVEQVVAVYRKRSMNMTRADEEILTICGISNEKGFSYDERIQKVLSYVGRLDTIEGTLVDELSREVYLSKSRLSHLFKEQTGMTLHSYLSFEKLHKAFFLIDEGKTVTESCMQAGFDSPSHFSATCKRMFGISISNIYKTIATN